MVAARLVKAVVAGAAALTVPVGMTVMMFGSPSPAAAGSSDTGGSLSGCGNAGLLQYDPFGGGELPTVPGFSAEQVRIAQVILSVAQELAVPQRGVVIALATGMQESGLRNLSYGDSDSQGVFQQRPSADWGTVAQVTDPVYAARAFFTGAGTNRGLLDVPGWQSMPLTVAAQAVQHSGYPEAYARHEDDAVRLLSGLTDEPLPCPTPAPHGAGDPPAPYPGGATGCTITDPTGRDGGCVTGAMLWATQQIAAHVGHWKWGIGCWDEHAWNPHSDHPKGQACDYMVGRGGKFPGPADKAVGDGLAEWLVAYAGELHVKYVIWQGRIWQPGRGWKPYGGGGVYDPHDATGGHYDHVHLSVDE